MHSEEAAGLACPLTELLAVCYFHLLISSRDLKSLLLGGGRDDR